jgi:hypothetical protein
MEYWIIFKQFLDSLMISNLMEHHELFNQFFRDVFTVGNNEVFKGFVIEKIGS